MPVLDLGPAMADRPLARLASGRHAARLKPDSGSPPCHPITRRACRVWVRALRPGPSVHGDGTLPTPDGAQALFVPRAAVTVRINGATVCWRGLLAERDDDLLIVQRGDPIPAIFAVGFGRSVAIGLWTPHAAGLVRATVSGRSLHTLVPLINRAVRMFERHTMQKPMLTLGFNRWGLRQDLMVDIANHGWSPAEFALHEAGIAPSAPTAQASPDQANADCCLELTARERWERALDEVIHRQERCVRRAARARRARVLELSNASLVVWAGMEPQRVRGIPDIKRL